MEDSFFTIQSSATGIFKDRQSKFISYAFPVCSEEEIKSILKDLRKKHFDAAHLPYAYILGVEKKIAHSSDDGEPHNSSGPAILNIIKSKNLTNICIIVVRYFGGTKLGIPGLINAFKAASEDVLQNSIIVKKILTSKIKIFFEYELLNGVMNICKKHNLEVSNQIFDQICSFEIIVPQINVNEISEKLKPFVKDLKIE